MNPKSCVDFFLTLSIPGIITMAVPGVRDNIPEFTVVQEKLYLPHFLLIFIEFTLQIKNMMSYWQNK